MEDSMNALQSYLNTLKDKGIVFQLSICNNESIRLIITGSVGAGCRCWFDRRVRCIEEGISNLLEEVENYVESIVK